MAHNSQHDEESDHKYALRLSEELNGGQQLPLSSTHEAPDLDYDSEADFAYALELQFGESRGMENGAGEGSKSHRPRVENPIGDPPWALNENDQKTANYHPKTLSGKTFNTLTDFIQHLKSVKCSTCGHLFFTSELDVSAMLQNWKCGKASLTTSLKCLNCSNTSCITCTPQPYANTSTISVQGKPQLSWCCNSSRLLLLWLVLCGLDEHYSTTKEAEKAKIKPDSKPDRKKKKPNKRGRGGGIGFGGPSTPYMPPGMGYGSDMMDYDDDEDFYEGLAAGHAFSGAGHTLSGHRFGPGTADTGDKAKAMSAQNSEDQYLATQIELVEGLLPLWERESSFDLDPPDAVPDMLIHSKILHCCTELLRNDSLEDATKRKNVYQALFKLLRTLATHPITINRIIYDERPVRHDKANLLEWCWQKSQQSPEEKTSSLFSCLRNLAEQSDLVLQGAKSNEKEFQTYEGQNLLLLCRKISDLHAFLLANAQPSVAAKSTQSEPEVPALSELADNVILATHKFGATAKALSGARTGRFKRLITEITNLKTGLPPGIFVRYAESRPDVLKVVIVGPVGTPYENGLFEFDVWCDGTFPDKPPLVQFKTTGGGRIGFNPNLYPDGKVCLSLLGTWQGPSWETSTSTLLQVLVSIQAMILCDEPWYNEPGREMSYSRNAASGPSKAYNQTLRQHTVRVAMLEWLDKTPPIWKDVVDQHFKINANKILETVVEWAKAKKQTSHPGEYMGEDFDEMILQHPSLVGSPRGSSSQTNDLRFMLPKLQKALKSYGATYVVPAIPEPVVEKSEPPRTRRTNSLFSHLSQPPQSQPYVAGTGFPGQVYLSPNPYAPTSPTYTPPPPPTASPGWFNFGPFAGAGHVVGQAPTPSSPTTPGYGGRGGTVRYETRSSTRGRGGPSITPEGSNSFGRGGYGRGRGGATDMLAPRGGYTSLPPSPYPQGRGSGTSDPLVPTTTNGQDGWTYSPFYRGGGRGGRGRGRGDTPDDARGGRGGRGGRGSRGGRGTQS